jgi:hypothetical protein
VGDLPVAGRTFVIHVSYIYGGVTFNDTLTLGPTSATGVARACPARQYPAGAQLTISSDPVDNSPGPPGSGLSDVQVQNIIPRDAKPSFCP